MNKTPNNSIKCSVNSCAYHCGEQNYCTLNEIKAQVKKSEAKRS